MRSRQTAALGVSLFAIACNQRVVLPVLTGGESSSGSTTTSLMSSSGTSASTTSSGASATGSSTGSASSTGGSSTSGSSTGTSSTGGSAPSPYADGGYVHCGTSGEAPWMCQPGTYFCDVGTSGQCFQCLSDADCANQELPTYDPNRPHCDLASGVPGYQNFCQQCVSNADCASNPAGAVCDLNPDYPPAAQQPSIDITGFETCSRLQTDCRLDGGPPCRGYNQYCDPDAGRCATRSDKCTSDQDCVGVDSAFGAALPAPYCVAGTCSACDGGGVCPEAIGCNDDTQCGNPSGSPSGLICNTVTSHCSCTSSGQCGGFWPVCLEFDAGLGSYCGCDSNSQCGDGGLACLTGPTSGSITGVCGIPCTSPLAPACGFQACNALTGTCDPCKSDADCEADPLTNGNFCYAPSGFSGACGCQGNGDCRPGEDCQSEPGNPFGICTVALQRCTPGSCGQYFCDWDSGSCAGAGMCFDDYDCATQAGNSYDPAAFCQNGQCVDCRSNIDCLHSGAAANGAAMCCLPGDKVCSDYSLPSNTCEQVCASDQDCVGSYYGPSCAVGDGGLTPHCGCANDSDCTGVYSGLRCDRTPSSVFFGSCGCAVDSDCSAGYACTDFIGSSGRCSASCYLDAGCAVGFECDANLKCRPRCDPGHGCEEPDLICDQGNVVGENGLGNLGSVPGATWCYACLHATDCPGGVGCDPELGCGTCRTSSDCPTGKACVDGGVCQPTCVDGGCAPGEVCDTGGAAGYGTNVCFGCVSSVDCPNGEGCNSESHTCGTCTGPTAEGAPFDCPPDAICSNYWRPTEPWLAPSSAAGVCLTNCDRQSCPADQPICAVLPGLTPDHKYCFGCLQDSDCADAGPGAYCDVTPTPTFECRLPAGQ